MDYKTYSISWNVKDAHNVISIAVDGNGFIHMAFNHHSNRLNYCRSLDSGSLEFGDLEPMTSVDENNVTYPEFYNLACGDLIFVYRSGSSGRGNLVMNRYILNSGRWQRIHDILIDGEGQRNAYWQLHVDHKDIIHLSWIWRESWLVETNHDMCYARSFDGGYTWCRTDGSKYNLPIKSSDAEYAYRIPCGSELINQTGMSSDKDGNPYIATYWRDSCNNVPQYRILWHDGVKWNHNCVTNRVTPFSLSGGGTKMIPISRPRILIDNNKIYVLFRDTERGSKVSIACNSDLSYNNGSFTDLTDFSVEAWEPIIDTSLWNQSKKLHILVQKTYQGDAERSVDSKPTPIYVLEINKSILKF